MFTQRISKNAQEILDRISVVLPDRTYLAGGTALALQIDHRDSYDLDLFSPNEYDQQAVLERVKEISPEYSSFGETTWQTLHGRIEDTEISLFCYKYPLLAPTTIFNNFPLASIEDIASMKLQAIAGRGIKRDFFDLYKILQNKNWRVIDTMRMHEQKYGNDGHVVPHLFQSLTYFEDAETKPERAKIVDQEWQQVKNFFIREVPLAQREYLEG